MDAATPPASSAPVSTAHAERRGIILITLSALVWSTGGMIVRFIGVEDSWTIVFWRSLFASLFLLGFMLLRDGPRGTLALIRGMGGPGVAVGLCLGTSSVCFVLAVSYTTVANVILINAGVPLLAALISWIVYRRHIDMVTWGAILAVLAGVAIMVSDSLTTDRSPIGDILGIVVALAFSVATVITREYSGIRMTPAAFLGAVVAFLVASVLAGGYAVSTPDLALLVCFGAFHLALGLALFVTGARLVPAALAALIGTLETILAPIWVWIVHNEVPTSLTLVGGGVVFAALMVHILIGYLRPRQA